jgi:tRNA (guanine-N7-)-methyltransferase
MFDQMGNCFQLEQWQQVAAERLAGQDLVLEVGAGSGLFAVELAARWPQKLLLAIDIKSDRLYRGAKRAAELGLENIIFIRSRVEQLAEIAPGGSASQIWLTFSDPYPRKSDARHRLTATRFLQIYQQLLLKGSTLKQTGSLHFKTDNAKFFDWSLEQLMENGWEIRFKTRDLQVSAAPEEAKITTVYEQKFLAAGKKICYLEASKL